MAKLNNKAPKAAEADKKLAKVNKKSVTIQKADKKSVKNLKAKAEKSTPAGNALTKAASPKKRAGKAKSLQKKTTPTGGAPIVPKKAKKLLKAGAKPTKDLVSREDVAKCVTVFKSAIQSSLAEKKAMLDPDFKYILQLCCFKIPQCPERIARTQLTHSMVDETDDICLFVKDIEAGNKRDYQPTIDFFREKLDAAGVTNIKTIMPISQIAKDYKQHEMIRKLCNSYDCFLTDGRIAPHLAKKLGKTFFLHKKSPVSVRMSHPQLKEHINGAVAKVAYHQTSSGDSTAIPIAKHCMDEEKVVDNIQKVLQNMRTEYPGGLQNLKRVFLRPAINLAKSSVPVYVNASSGENVPVPSIEGPRAKAVAAKQKKINKLLPEGMIMTNKGELAFVASKKRKAKDQGDDQPAGKKQKKEKDGKKTKKEKLVAAEKTNKKDKKKVKEAAVVEAPAPVPVAEKKQKKVKETVAEPVVEPKKQKKVKETVAEPVVEPKKAKKEKKVAADPVPEPEPVVEEKKPKKEKRKAEAVVAEVVPAAKVPKGKGKKATAEVAVPEPAQEGEKKKAKGKKGAAAVAEEAVETKPAKKGGKKEKVKPAALDASDADLSKEVSDLWEQIKNESGVDMGESKPKKRKASAAPVEEKKPKKKAVVKKK